MPAKVLGKTASSAATAARDILTTAKDVGHAAASVVHLSDDQKKAARSHAQQATGQVANVVSDIASKGMGAQKAAVAQVTEFIEIWLKQKLQKRIEYVIDKIPAAAKSATDDPEMPDFVKRGKDRCIDGVWPDCKEELMWRVVVVLDAQTEDKMVKSSAPDCVRGFLRYHIYPADKTIWGKIKDPVWIIFLLASLIPWAGITPLIFLFCFVIIDKSDEYQLIAFILQFKGTQFISHGILRTIIGFYLYLGCVTAPAKEDDHHCEDSGPGIAGPMEVILGGWFLQVILIWIAFILVNYSKAKGKRELKGKIQFEHASSSGTIGGGYLGYLMIYDLVCFTICVGTLAWVFSTRPEMRHDEWVVKHAFYAVQILYGFCSLPFFFLILPILQPILTHSSPTAYDPEGRCVRHTGPQIPKPPKEESKIFSVEEAQMFLNNIRDVTLGKISGKAAALKELQQQQFAETRIQQEDDMQLKCADNI